MAEQDPQENVYLQFETFDFDNDDFQNGLLNVFESYLDQMNQQNDGQIQELVTEIPEEERQRLTIQAKAFYFCSQTGEILNIEDYEEWKDKKAKEEQMEQSDEPEYSLNYQELVKLILEGKEVPGIKQIPDTVLKGESTESKANARLKPWEKKEEEEGEEEEVVVVVEAEESK